MSLLFAPPVTVSHQRGHFKVEESCNIMWDVNFWIVESLLVHFFVEVTNMGLCFRSLLTLTVFTTFSFILDHSDSEFNVNGGWKIVRHRHVNVRL